MGAFPVVAADIQGFLGVSPATPADEAAQVNAAAAASAWVADRVLGVDVMPTEVKDYVRQGTIMLAARWYVRRSSVTGITAFGELGVGYVVRHDPDIATQLGLNMPGVV